MLEQGPLGTRADWLMDLVIISLVVIIPVILLSWSKARHREYKTHKNIQVWLTGILTVVVLLFELDLRLAGGMEVLTEGSRYFGTTFLNVSTYIHLFFSVSTAIIWLVLIAFSLRRFSKFAQTKEWFGKQHKFWGKIGMIWMIMTGLTGLELYIIGFVL